MPRFGSVCDESVWRVPKPTRVSIVCRSCAWLTGATIARSLRIRRGRRRGADQRPGCTAATSLRITTLLSFVALAGATSQFRARIALCSPGATRRWPIRGGHFMRNYRIASAAARLEPCRVGRRRRAGDPADPDRGAERGRDQPALRHVRRAKHGDAPCAGNREGPVDRRDDARCLRPAQRAARRRPAAKRRIYRQVSPTAASREAGEKCEVRMASEGTKLSLSRPIYERIKAIKAPAATQRPSFT